MTHWPHPERVASALHQGDLGWHLRLEDAAIQDDAFVGWWDDDTLLAVGLVEGVLGRFSVRPGHDRDPDLGEHVAQVCRELPADSEVYADLRPETATRRILAGEGWTLDPEPWVALHADLDRWQPAVDLDRCEVVEAADAVADRVAVQRSGFERSTFTEEAWARMAAGPGYRRDLDLVLVGDGVPASIATAWWAGEGATAILEPVATHRDHRGRGLGRPRGHRPHHAPAGPRRLGGHGVHAARLRRRDRDLPRRRAARGRALPVAGASVHRVGLGDPPRCRARAPAPRGGWTAGRAAAPSGRRPPSPATASTRTSVTSRTSRRPDSRSTRAASTWVRIPVTRRPRSR